jgi:tungstate transport system ATP-binding protein
VNEAICYRQLRKRINGRLLFAIDELLLQPGECVALSGRNGAGKSTLMRVLAGIEAADAMQLQQQGRGYSGKAARQWLRAQVIYVHQQPYLFDRSVADNVGYGLRCQGIKAEQAAQRVDEALDWAGLMQLRARNANTLSGGERQRLALARARVLRPRLLLLDEPTANLDRPARQQTWDMVSKLTADGVGVLLATHEYPTVAALCARHLLLDNAALYALGDSVIEPFWTPMRQPA